MSNSNSSDDLSRPLSSWEKDFLVECKEDHVGIWEAIAIAREHDPCLGRRPILSSIEQLLADGLIVAGLPAADWRGFDAWLGTAEFITKRIDREWRGLGHDPELGDIVWFTTDDAPERPLSA